MLRALALAAALVCASGAVAHAESGIASVYGTPQDGYCGKPVACARKICGAEGGVLDCKAYTAAHRTLPFGTAVKVKSAATNLSIVVHINDRGPFVKGRIIDLTPAAAAAIGCPGLCQVTIETITGWVPTSGELFKGAQ